MEDWLAENRSTYDEDRPYYYPSISKESSKVCFIKPLWSDLHEYTNYQLFYTPDGEVINFNTYAELEDWVKENIPLEHLDSDDYPILTQQAYLK